MKNKVIEITDITKKYYLESPRTLKKLFQNVFRPFSTFTVIRDFSFTANQGEFILVTGPNGSGKTTLLKLIAGITSPDKGLIRTVGRIVPLIELGAGFNYELSGMENALIYASILGISKKEIKRIMQEIVAYSGLKEFINIPLKRYSSGMITRLAFSIAAFSKPDVLLLDEVFAVGDKDFRNKSIKQIEQFRKNKVTILFSTNYDYHFSFVDRKIQLTRHF